MSHQWPGAAARWELVGTRPEGMSAEQLGELLDGQTGVTHDLPTAGDG